jgi:hypothetical protein
VNSVTDNVHYIKMVVLNIRFVNHKGNISKDSLKKVYMGVLWKFCQLKECKFMKERRNFVTVKLTANNEACHFFPRCLAFKMQMICEIQCKCLAAC